MITRYTIKKTTFSLFIASRIGLINTKTGNSIPDKLVERLINRQRLQMGQVSSMRLKYIILKQLVANKQDSIAAIDNIGEGLRLRDYEQIKVENRLIYTFLFF